MLARYENEIRRWFLKRVPVSEADDLVQDTACAIIESFPHFRRKSSERTWVYAICRNVLYRYYRGSFGLAVALDPDSLPEIPVDPSAKLAVAIAVDLLPPRLRSVYELRFERGLTVCQISELLKRPTGTVKYQLHEIRFQLKRYLQE